MSTEPATAESVIERISPSVQRINNLKERLSGLFVGKDEIIRMMCVSTAAREPLLLVGEPGTAKSDLIVQFCEAMGVTREGDGSNGASYFEFLLTPFTEPSEVFGPVKIDEYTQKQIYSRNSRGMLQESEVVFLDEVFKANSAILNSLLTILNERKFYDGGRPIPVPLVVIFGATNEVPSTDELAALFDRFTLRVECRNLKTEEEMLDLIRLGTRRESSRSRQMLGEPGVTDTDEPMPSLDDFEQVFRAAVELLDEESFHKSQAIFLDTFSKKVRAIRTDRLVRLNDRKVIKLLKMMLVNAILEGRNIGRQDQELLQYTWDNPYDLEGRRRLKEIAGDE